MLKLKVRNTSPSAKFISTKAQKFCIKNGIKFLYMKKQKMNYDLYHVHLQMSKEWKSSWGLIDL